MASDGQHGHADAGGHGHGHAPKTGDGDGDGHGHGDGDGHGDGHGDGQGHRHGGQHGNPADLASYIERIAGDDRAAWQKPDEVIGALGLTAGQVVCDVGAGPGYFSLRIARVVGERGRVFAVDVEPQMLSVLRHRIVTAGVRNVTPVLALPDDPLLPEAGCDLILVVDTFHHFPDGVAYLKRLARALRPGGRLVNIDFHKLELPVGPPLIHKVSREELLDKARAAGFTLTGEQAFLPHQYFLEFKAVGAMP